MGESGDVTSSETRSKTPPETTPEAPSGAPLETPQLLVWALAAFHAALIVVLSVGILYGTGTVGGLLAGLDTSIGVIAYLYLWGATWWTNRALLDGLEEDVVGDRPNYSEVVAGATKWGGVAGLLVFLPLLLVVTVLFVGAGSLEALPFLALAGATGALLATGIGVVVGVALALLDLLLLQAARSWLPFGAGVVGDSEPRNGD